jgi:hypothetical protein
MLQSIIIPKSKFTKREAIDWIRKHNHHIYKIDITDKFYRFRQREPRAHGKYYTVSLPNGIEMLYEINF